MQICNKCGCRISKADYKCRNCGATLYEHYNFDLNNACKRARRRNVRIVTNTVMGIFLAVAIVFTALSFSLSDNKSTFIIIALFCYLMYFIVLLVKHIKISKIEKTTLR